MRHSPKNMVFKCKNCGSKKGVQNGWCPNCGPIQTDAADYETKVAVEAIEVAKSAPKEEIQDAEIVEE